MELVDVRASVFIMCSRGNVERNAALKQPFSLEENSRCWTLELSTCDRSMSLSYFNKSAQLQPNSSFHRPAYFT